MKIKIICFFILIVAIECISTSSILGKWYVGWVEAGIVEICGYYSTPCHHGLDEVSVIKSAVPTMYPDNWDGFGAENDGAWGSSIYAHNGKPVSKKSIKDDKLFLATTWFHTSHEANLTAEGHSNIIILMGNYSLSTFLNKNNSVV